MLSLDELANGKLPKHLIDSIGELEISVLELATWKSSQPPIIIAFKDGRLILDVHLRIKLVKAIAVFAGVVGLVWTIIKFAIEDLPTMLDLLAKFPNS